MTVWEKLADAAYGIAFVGGGVGVLYLTKYIPQKWKNLGYASGVGLGAYGAYSIYSSLTEPKGEKPTPEKEFPLIIGDPRPGTQWSVLRPHTVDVQVNNPYDKRYRIYLGLSMIHDETGEVFDFPIQTIDLDPGETKQTGWWMWGSPQGTGLYWVISAVWDTYPKPPCEEEGTCHRIGEAESNVTFGYF